MLREARKRENGGWAFSKKRGTLLLSLLIVGLLLNMAVASLLVSAAPPDKCDPWPECKGGGGGEEPPADPAIAFIRKKGLTAILTVMNADGTNQVDLDSERYLRNPTWSPDGSSIAYLKGVPFDLYRIDVTVVDGSVQGGEPTLLYEDILMEPAWSPLGDKIAFIQRIYTPSIGLDRPRLVQTISLGDGSVETLYTADEGSYLHSPTWSPDATRIAFIDWTRTYRSYINILTIGSGEPPETVYEYGLTGISYLDWSRTPDKLAFQLWPPLDGSESSAIYTLDITQSNPTPQFVSGGGSRCPSWSPDDTQLVFDRQGNQAKIFTYDFATGETTELAKGRNPDWSRA